MSINKSGTFIYTPDIVVGIMTNNGFRDVSADVIDFTLQRQVNAIASFSCTLANPQRKYNRVINTMDRITVFLKRTTYVQVFTGYVTRAPIETIVPTPITIDAQCTIRLLKTTYWDDTLIQFQQLLLNYMDPAMTSTSQTYNDGGVSQVIVQVLARVVGWDPAKIHVQGIPQEFIDFAAKVYSNQIASGKDLDQNVISEIASLIGSSGIVSGFNTGTTITNYGGVSTVSNSTSPQPTLTKFTVSKAQAFKCKSFAGGKDNSPGRHGDNPVSIDLIGQDIYWCSVPFAYFKSKGIGTPKQIDSAKQWISYNHAKDTYDGQLLVLTNQKYKKVVVVRATSIPQKPGLTQNGGAVGDSDADYMQLHPGVVAYLNNKVSDPKAWVEGNSTGNGDGLWTFVSVEWSKEKNINAGPQTQVEAAIKDASKQINSALGDHSSTDSLVVTSAANQVINKMRSVIGATYPKDDEKQPKYPANWRSNPGYVNPSNNKTGLFDCSGLVQWAFHAAVQVDVGSAKWPSGYTKTQYGPSDHSQADIYGAYIDVNTQPQVGDILFFYMHGDSIQPGHVMTLSSAFGQKNTFKNAAAQSDVGWVIQAMGTGIPLDETKIHWSWLKGGKPNAALEAYLGPKGCYYMGARRPLTKLKNTNIGTGSFTATNTTSSDPNNAGQRATLSLDGAWNNVWNAPQYDVRASILQGTPRAFLLDNPVMNDLEQIISAGMRCYQSAPNGDFISWFPDYYGLYGTDPVLEISDVEILDFQIYHNDDNLATHIGIIGDTNGIGQNVSYADYLTTNGIVSIQDGATMQMLFKKVNLQTGIEAENAATAFNFLQKYGIRPFVQEQNMIHSHSLEYMMGLWTFMNKWVQQFESTVSLTFMPELYPGMRIVINVDGDSYQFYCTGVTHQGSRSSGFQTQATLTAPIKNNEILDYGLDIA